MLMELFILIIILLLVCGVVAGFLAGFFGIGGGIIMVPVMYALLSDLGYQDYAMNISVATSAAVILPTALAGTARNYRKEKFSLRPALILGVGGIIGSMAGSTLSVLIPKQVHVIAFSGFLIFMAFWMIINQCSYFSRYSFRESVFIYIPLGIGVGIAAGLFGIGGGIILTPVLTSFLGVNIHRSVTMSLSAMVLIASGTVLSYIFLGWGLTGLFPFSLGYVNVLFAVVLAFASVPSVHLGVKAGMKMSEKNLLILFISMLIFLAIQMVFSA